MRACAKAAIEVLHKREATELPLISRLLCDRAVLAATLDQYVIRSRRHRTALAMIHSVLAGRYALNRKATTTAAHLRSPQALISPNLSNISKYKYSLKKKTKKLVRNQQVLSFSDRECLFTSYLLP